MKAFVQWLIERKLLVAAFAALALCYSGVLIDLARYGSKVDLYSHALLMPFITGYLLWIQRDSFKAARFQWSWASGALGAIGLGLLVLYWSAPTLGWVPSPNDRLAVLVASFVGFAIALALAFGGRENRGKLLFPAGLLIFMAPMPDALTQGVTVFLQVLSADVAYAMIWLTGTSIFRQGLHFTMPGLEVVVAEECSGIRSTYVLLITSLIAGYLFLKQSSGKWLLAAMVIPLGIFRNGIRILTISWISVHISHDLGINGLIHHRGGPLFFAISLAPLLGLLWWLRKRENAKQRPQAARPQPLEASI